jgi:hypothetical protein
MILHSFPFCSSLLYASLLYSSFSSHLQGLIEQYTNCVLECTPFPFPKATVFSWEHDEPSDFVTTQVLGKKTKKTHGCLIGLAPLIMSALLVRSWDLNVCAIPPSMMGLRVDFLASQKWTPGALHNPCAGLALPCHKADMRVARNVAMMGPYQLETNYIHIYIIYYVCIYIYTHTHIHTYIHTLPCQFPNNTGATIAIWLVLSRPSSPICGPVWGPIFVEKCIPPTMPVIGQDL